MVLDVSTLPQAADRVKDLGYGTTPVVEVVTESGGFAWHGFRLDKLNHLKEITR